MFVQHNRGLGFMEWYEKGLFDFFVVDIFSGTVGNGFIAGRILCYVNVALGLLGAGVLRRVCMTLVLIAPLNKKHGAKQPEQNPAYDDGNKNILHEAIGVRQRYYLKEFIKVSRSLLCQQADARISCGVRSSDLTLFLFYLEPVRAEVLTAQNKGEVVQRISYHSKLRLTKELCFKRRVWKDVGLPCSTIKKTVLRLPHQLTNPDCT
jgi:hypothetical protein